MANVWCRRLESSAKFGVRPQKAQFTVAGQEVVLADLGDPLIEEFLSFYTSYFTKTVFDASTMLKSSFAFFDANCDNHEVIDAYFQNYRAFWMDFLSHNKYTEASKSLEAFPLTLAYEWEGSRGKLLHKGTPYYFLGVSKIAVDNLDEGFLFLRQALEEDRRTHGISRPPTPAYYFITLDHSNQDYYFLGRVKQTSEYLEERLAEYRQRRNRRLTLSEFIENFLKSPRYGDELVFYFTVVLHKLLGYSHVISDVKQNRFASLEESTLLASMLTVLDSILRRRAPGVDGIPFRELLGALSSSDGGASGIGNRALRRLSTDFGKDYSKTIDDLVSSRYSLRSNGDLFSPIGEDIALAFGLHDFGIMNIEHASILVQHYEEILQRLFNLIFLSIELDPFTLGM